MKTNDELTLAKQAREEYEKTGAMPTVPDTTKRFDVWRHVFQEHFDVWQHVCCVDETKKAADAMFVLLAAAASSAWDKHKRVCLSMACKLCAASICAYDWEDGTAGGNYKSLKQRKEWQALFRKIQPEVAKIWLDAVVAAGIKDEFFATILGKDITVFMPPHTLKVIEEAIRGY